MIAASSTSTRNRCERHYRTMAIMATGLLAASLMLAGCQPGAVKTPAANDAGALGRLAKLLTGDFDNHEQATAAAAKSTSGAAPMRVRSTLRIVRSDRDEVVWLWRLQTQNTEPSVWLLRAQLQADHQHVRLLPYRPLDAAAARTAAGDPGKPFVYEPAQWAELEPCAQVGAWDKDTFTAAASVEACSALLPGLGDDAALLPLRLAVDGDTLRVATFADRSRGPDATELLRRVQWFSGWAAINGGGPAAKAGNQDWHLQRDLRLSSEGGRASLHWRDGAASGYSVELERTSYPERKLSVLQLNVIEDASGKTMTYAWSDSQAAAIGVNLGWLQIGLVRDDTTAAGKP
jgi:hypothetical protein